MKLNFVRIPAGEFVMGSYNGEPDAYPTAKVKIDKAFWMGELEVTNQQYNVIFPEHDSRYVDQQWKDHVVQGYPANEPQQPVIRVSYRPTPWQYCKKLSAKTGLKITLPTRSPMGVGLSVPAATRTSGTEPKTAISVKRQSRR